MIDPLLEGASPAAAGTVSETGWSNTEIFSDYMKNHLLKFLPPRSDDSPVLILYDEHKSHVSLGLIEWAKKENIILFILPPHCSHLLQPLDVSCFGPFENSWNVACHHYMRESGGKLVTRHDVCRLACKVYLQTLTASNIQPAFKKSGLIPFNASVVPDSQVAPSTTFIRGCEEASVKAPVSSSLPVSISAEDFLQRKGGKILENVLTAKKQRNTLSRVVGGKAIPEDEIVTKIIEHKEKSGSKRKQIRSYSKGKKNKTTENKSQKSSKRSRCD